MTHISANIGEPRDRYPFFDYFAVIISFQFTVDTAVE
jgi:hypothetical protein